MWRSFRREAAREIAMAGRRTARQIVLRDDEHSELEGWSATQDWGGNGDVGTHRSGMRRRTSEQERSWRRLEPVKSPSASGVVVSPSTGWMGSMTSLARSAANDR